MNNEENVREGEIERKKEKQNQPKTKLRTENRKKVNIAKQTR